MNAQHARQISDEKNHKPVAKIIEMIKAEAEKGRYALHLYEPQSDSQMTYLREMGYNVYQHGTAAIQKDGLYYTISW